MRLLGRLLCDAVSRDFGIRSGLKPVPWLTRLNPVDSARSALVRSSARRYNPIFHKKAAWADSSSPLFFA